jgi:hypothetical protein
MIIMAQSTALHMDLFTAQLAQKACRQRYKIQKNAADELRQAFQLQVNERRAIKDGTSVETQHKITQNAFRSKNAFSRIRKVLKRNARQAITYVALTDEYDLTVECFDRAEIDDACIQEGRKRYSQSHDTPFLTPPSLGDFGFIGNQNQIQAVLDGTYECPDGIHIYTKTLFTNYASQPK